METKIPLSCKRLGRCKFDIFFLACRFAYIFFLSFFQGFKRVCPWVQVGKGETCRTYRFWPAPLAIPLPFSSEPNPFSLSHTHTLFLSVCWQLSDLIFGNFATRARTGAVCDRESKGRRCCGEVAPPSYDQ